MAKTIIAIVAIYFIYKYILPIILAPIMFIIKCAIIGIIAMATLISIIYILFT